MKKALIDTNIYSNAMRGSADVTSVLRTLSTIGISAISIGELYSGFKGGSRERLNCEELDQFLDSPRVVLFGVDEVTATFYASVLNQLKKQGTPIPTNDIWIAAIALQHGLPIFTLDKHFSHVGGLIHL